VSIALVSQSKLNVSGWIIHLSETEDRGFESLSLLEVAKQNI